RHSPLTPHPPPLTPPTHPTPHTSHLLYIGQAMWQGQRVSVVFPAYNEQDGIADAVADFQRVDAVDEVIVVDNNSRDATAERALEAGARVIKETRQGYGNALRRGMQEAIGEYVVLAEPDGTFIGKDVLKLLT